MRRMNRIAFAIATGIFLWTQLSTTTMAEDKDETAPLQPEFTDALIQFLNTSP